MRRQHRYTVTSANFDSARLSDGLTTKLRVGLNGRARRFTVEHCARANQASAP
jgi:hypothetical protein